MLKRINRVHRRLTRFMGLILAIVWLTPIPMALAQAGAQRYAFSGRAAPGAYNQCGHQEY